MKSKIWFISDTHFGHANIIKYCNRPYSSVEEMDNSLIAKINEKIGPNDIVWFLGDFTMESDWKTVIKYMNSLNGKWHMVLGNHDRINQMKKAMHYYGALPLKDPLCGKILSVQEFAKIKVNKIKIIMCHYPLVSWEGNYKGSIHLHGHMHGTMEEIVLGRIDVGVDCNEYEPWSLEDIFDVVTEEWMQGGMVHTSRGANFQTEREV